MFEDLVVKDTLVKDTQTSNNKENSTSADFIEEKNSTNENSELTLDDVTSSMKESVNKTQSSEILPQTGVQQSNALATGMIVSSSSILLLSIAIKVMTNSFKKL